MPFALIPLMLLIVPVVEIAAFIVIGGQIGTLPTLAMIFVTALVGTFLLRRQGLGLLQTIQAETQAGRIPGKALGHGVMILVAGILLLTPGFVTDAIGFSLFVPQVRSAIWRFLATRITVVAASRAGIDPRHFEPGAPFGERPVPPAGDGPVIDLDATDYDVEASRPTGAPRGPDSR